MKVNLLKVFVASPGDVHNERGVVREVIEDVNRTSGQEKGIVLSAQTQHSCHQGQSNQPEKVSLGHRGAIKPSGTRSRIPLFGLTLRNSARFPGMARSRPLDSAAFSSPFAQKAKWRPLSVPLE
jgi:hypothetical protein